MNYIHVILLKKSSKNSLLTFLELFLLELLEMPGYFHSLLFVHFVQNKIYKQKKILVQKENIVLQNLQVILNQKKKLLHTKLI